MSKRVFIQGAREVTWKQRQAAFGLGCLLKEAGWEANVGELGQLVSIMQESGIPCHIHLHTTRQREEDPIRGTFIASVTDCVTLAESLPQEEDEFPEVTKMVAWGIRLGHLIGKSQAFIFFAGAEGTIAHLVPVLAMIKKHYAKKEIFPRVAFVEWEEEKLNAIGTLFDLGFEDFSWCQNFRLDQMDQVAHFITQ